MKNTISTIVAVILIIAIISMINLYSGVREQLAEASLEIILLQIANEKLEQKVEHSDELWKDTCLFAQQQMHRADHAEIALRELGYDIKEVSNYYR